MRDACSYLRVSGDSQIQGDGFPRQREACLKYADTARLEIVEEFRDEGITGKMEMENREGLSACLRYIQENKITVVVVEDSTRLARDLIVAEVLIREFQKAGVRVISASGGIDLTEGDDTNPTAKLIRQILAAVSEFERCCINLKLRGARQRKKAATGRCEGRKPYGYYPDEEWAWGWIQRMHSDGLKAETMAEALNMGGSKSRSGVAWRGSTIRKMLARKVAA